MRGDLEEGRAHVLTDYPDKRRLFLTCVRHMSSMRSDTSLIIKMENCSGLCSDVLVGKRSDICPAVKCDVCCDTWSDFRLDFVYVLKSDMGSAIKPATFSNICAYKASDVWFGMLYGKCTEILHGKPSDILAGVLCGIILREYIFTPFPAAYRAYLVAKF